MNYEHMWEQCMPYIHILTAAIKCEEKVKLPVSKLYIMKTKCGVEMKSHTFLTHALYEGE